MFKFKIPDFVACKADELDRSLRKTWKTAIEMIKSKKSLSEYRDGAIGSVMDEYERALSELKSVLQNVSEADYTRVADSETKNDDCRSIETVMNHVVRSGHFYADYVRDALSMDLQPVQPGEVVYDNVSDEIDKMFLDTLSIFSGRWDEMNDLMKTVFINSRWGITYNIDQMFEHAIVHALRHRRQIEKFLLKFEEARG